MITIKTLKQTMSGYKMLRFYHNNNEVAIGDTLTLDHLEPTDFLKIMVNEKGYIEIWTEDINGKETEINWRKNERVY